MIVLDEPRRIDEVGAANGIENIVDGDARRKKASRFGHDVELWNAAALHKDGSNAIEPVDARLEVVGGNFPKLILRNGVGRQAVAENGKRGEGEAVRLDLGARRQFRLQTGHDGVDTLERQNHVARPVEKKIDLRGTAAGDGLNFLQTGNAVDGFFDGARDDHQHLVDGHHTVVDANDDARKIRIGKDRNGNGEGEVSADQHQSNNQEQN